MTPFLFTTARFIHNEYNGKFNRLCVVLPNKRATLFLKRHLSGLAGGTMLSPTILTIEELITEISGLVIPDTITLTLELFECWVSIERHQEESFQEFLKWSTMLLQDVNEADRNLTDAKDLFRNLKEVKQIENWSLSAEPLTDFQQRYLYFMEDLGLVYELLSQKLLKKNEAWQGLAYRESVKRLGNSAFVKRFDNFVFAGFNALNKAERELISQLRKERKAEIVYDADKYYLNDEKQEAGEFLRKNFRNDFLRSNSFVTDDLLSTPKTIEVVGTPKSMGQVAEAGARIRKWIQAGKNKESMAVVLADESLLFPLLSAIPDEIDALNVTLEYPLRLTSIYDLYEQLLQLQVQAASSNKSDLSFYYKDVYRLFYNPCFRILAGEKGEFFLHGIIDGIKRANISFVSGKWLQKESGGTLEAFDFVFKAWDNGGTALNFLSQINAIFLNHYREKKDKTVLDKIEQEFVLAFEQAIKRLVDLVQLHPVIDDLVSVYRLLKVVISEKSVPFFGEPLKGLQVMGVLETRTLDFEHVIVLGMNEGILPAGKGGASFIPWDLKRYFGLPLNTEKDAVYAYHFYRLMQRASEVLLVYNTEHDAFGSGEKSRFLTQSIMEMPVKNPQIQISSRIAGGSLKSVTGQAICIGKNEKILEKLELKCAPAGEFSGLSPSSLNLYKDCSLKFYFRYIASLSEDEDVEEDMEAGTFGSILHGALEQLYTPFIGKILFPEQLDFSDEQIHAVVQEAYQQNYQQKELLRGKNLLAVNIIEVYVKRMTKDDQLYITDLRKQQEELKMAGLEKELSWVVEVDCEGKKIPVKVMGKCDRLDQPGDFFRIVDYKSSVKTGVDKFIFQGYDDLFNGKGNSKMFQLFIYAWLAWRNNMSEPHLLMPCIIPFKNYSGTPQRVMADKKNPLIFSAELLQQFEEALKTFVSKIFSSSEEFVQTQDRRFCEFCGFKAICNR